ncbi:hypothetical protein DSECCO2_653700 [anaerobic digester metagenome]
MVTTVRTCGGKFVSGSSWDRPWKMSTRSREAAAGMARLRQSAGKARPAGHASCTCRASGRGIVQKGPVSRGANRV